MKKLWEDFKKFIKRGNVVDMAIGVAVASAFTAIVKAFTDGFIAPLIALLTNGSDLGDAKWIIREVTLDADGEILQAAVALKWGLFLQAIIDFFIVAFFLFIVLRIVSQLNTRAQKLTKAVKNALTDEDEKAAEAAAKAKAEEEAKKLAEEEAIAKAKAEQEAKIKREEERKAAELALLTEIRDLLKK